jgi:hypothetical protein
VASTVHSPRFGDEKSFVAAVENCYPLHPLSALLLPSIARQKFGQNERSLFSFLASGEPGGFREYLTATEDMETAPTYLPDRLWDYLDLNLQQVILASPVGHRWSEALEAVERATDKNHCGARPIWSAVHLARDAKPSSFYLRKTK